MNYIRICKDESYSKYIIIYCLLHILVSLYGITVVALFSSLRLRAGSNIKLMFVVKIIEAIGLDRMNEHYIFKNE